MGWLSKLTNNDTSPSSGGATRLSGTAQPLSPHPVLDVLPEAWRAAMFAAGKRRKFGAGDAVEMAEADTHALCLVLSGRVTPVISGGLLQTVNSADRGGHLWLQTGDEGATVQTLAQGPVAVLFLDPDAFDTLPEAQQVAVHKVLQRQTRDQQQRAIHHQIATARSEQLARTSIARVLARQRQMTAESDMVLKVLKSAPRLPMYAHQLISLLSDDTSSVSSVVEMANRDPSLAAEVLKTINSPYYSLSNKVSDLQHAVVLLGFDPIHQLVMAKGVEATMPNTTASRELLLRANAISFIGLEVARMGGFSKPVVMSTIGLLHGLGTGMALLLKAKFTHLASFIDLLDPPTIGASLLRTWELPETICATVGDQAHPHYLPPEDIPDGHRREVAVLYITQLCYGLFRNGKISDAETTHLASYQKLLGLKVETIPEFAENQLLPTLAAKKQNYPETMRRFFSACETQLLSRH